MQTKLFKISLIILVLLSLVAPNGLLSQAGGQVSTTDSETTQEPLSALLPSEELLFGEPDFPEEPLMPGRIEGTRTYFEIKDSEYLNIILKSSEEIKVVLESIPRMIGMDISSSTDFSFTNLTISGLEPNKTYYKYQDSYKNEAVFISDENGSYDWGQDLTQSHHIWIQEIKGTTFIDKDTVLDHDITGSVEITADNITLDCNGHSITGSATGYGIYLNGKKNNAIKNCTITNFSSGIYLLSSLNNTLTDDTTTGNYHGIFLYSSSGNILINNIADSNRYYGITISSSNNNTLNNNTVLNTRGHGINISHSSNHIFINNTTSGNYIGIYLHASSNNILTNNIASNNEKGIYLYASGGSTLTSNTMFSNAQNFIVVGEGFSLENNIDTSNTVDGKPIYYIQNATNQVYDNSTNAGTFYCINCNDVIVKDLILTKNGYGIFFWKTQNSRIENITTSGNWVGIRLLYSSNNIIRNNTIRDGISLSSSGNNTMTNNIVWGGIELWFFSNYNTFINNTVTSGFIGIYFYSSSNNKIYHNNFINNYWKQAYIYSGYGNLFDDGYPSGGNYWSDYTGVDLYSGPNQDQFGSDGIGDTSYISYSPYHTNVRVTDRYPFMKESGWKKQPYAVIVAGQADWRQKLAINHAANNAYRVLRNLGFNDGHIFYLNDNSQQISGQNVVDGSASLNNLRNSLNEIKQKIGDNPTPIILYLVGHGTKEVFDFYTESDALSSTDLREMLEAFTESPILVIIGSCYSGSFITLDYYTDSISASNRIIITATHDDQKRRSLLGLGGWYHSSDRFWGNLNEGMNVKNAFTTNAWWPGEWRHLWLDDNGDNIGHPPNNLADDGELAAKTQIGIPGTENLELTPWMLVWKRSPGELRVYDSQNRVTGLVNGEIQEQIPDSIYDEQDQVIVIFSPSDTYRYEVFSTEEGSYGLDIATIKGDQTEVFTAIDIPIYPDAIHQYIINWETLSSDKEAVILNIDNNGDGVFDQIVTTDNELNYDEFILQTETLIDFKPDTPNLRSKGKFTTVYIELPEGYGIEKIAEDDNNNGDSDDSDEENDEDVDWDDYRSLIDISTVKLNDQVPPVSDTRYEFVKEPELEDRNENGLPELMIKFKRDKVQSVLSSGEEVLIIITGQVFHNGRYIYFRGGDIIKTIKNFKD